MHQNTFLSTPEAKKYLFQGKVSGFQPLQTLKNIFFPGGLEPCENALKHGFNHSRRKKLFIFSGGLEACANASKRVFNHSRH
jgi:hypothetical protein